MPWRYSRRWRRRIAHLIRVGRPCPDLDAELFIDPDENRGAYLLTRVMQPATPKLNEVLHLIASPGGFLGRKGDGEPGAKAIWLGLKEVHVAAKRSLSRFVKSPNVMPPGKLK